MGKRRILTDEEIEAERKTYKKPIIYKTDESLENQMNLLRKDVINQTSIVVEEFRIMKGHIKGIKDVLRLMLKKRPDQTTKMRLKEIKDLLTEDK